MFGTHESLEHQSEEHSSEASKGGFKGRNNVFLLGRSRKSPLSSVGPERGTKVKMFQVRGSQGTGHRQMGESAC